MRKEGEAGKTEREGDDSGGGGQESEGASGGASPQVGPAVLSI